MECVNVARLNTSSAGGCGARSSQGPGCGRIYFVPLVTCPEVVCIPFVGIGSIHKSVDASLNPLKMTFSLYTTSHSLSSNISFHPALHNGLMPIRDATANVGTMWPVRVHGRPGMFMSHSCVNLTFLPSGRLIIKGFFVILLFSTSTPSIMKMAVAPVSAIA
jgi:hypothetical protein